MKQEPTESAQAAGNPLASAETWDLVADAYAADLSWAEHFAREALRLAALPPEPHIVDVACGPGTLALLAARGGATVSAVDFSPQMITNLNRRAKEAGLSLVEPRVGDGQHLPFDDKSFDGAFSMVGLVFFPDRAAGFRELYRVLKPGRPAVVSSIVSLEGPFGQVLEGIHANLPDLPYGGGQRPPLSTPEEFTDEMSSAGFRDVAIHTVTYREVTPTLDEYWARTQRSAAPVALLRRRLGKEPWSDVANSVLEHLRQTVGEGPLEDITTHHLALGVR